MRVDVYYRILVDAKVPRGLLKASLKRHTDEGCLRGWRRR